MRKDLLQAVGTVEMMLVNRQYLDRATYDDKLVSLSYTLHEDAPRPRLDTRKAYRKAVVQHRQTVAFLHAAATQHRREEVEVPVTHFQVEFLDVLREKRYWSFTLNDVETLRGSVAWQRLSETAARQNFAAELFVEAFTNAHHRKLGRMRVNLRFDFFEQLRRRGRRYRTTLRPPESEDAHD